MHPDFQPTVYLLASQRNGTLYVGVTSNLVARIHQHREGCVRGFTRKYGVKLLVWFEQHPTMESAITREKGIQTGETWRKTSVSKRSPWSSRKLGPGND